MATKLLNTETEMVGMTTVFTGSCLKLIAAQVSLGDTFSPNLMQILIGKLNFY